MVTSTLTSSAVHGKKKKKKKIERLMRRKKANALVIDSDIAIRDTLEDIRKARALAAKAGLSIECQTLPKTVYAPVENNDTSNAFGNNGTNIETAGLITTGGYLNKDHEVAWTGDEKKDRLAELRRNVWRRYRAMEPENRQEYRWDRPRQSGERRRRITRDLDLPDAPPEPPLTGFTAFMCQMTIKLRHDRPNVPHNQSKVIQEISKLWRVGLSEMEREYYNKFATDARDEHAKQMIEYRATGSFTPNQEFVKLPEVNVWVRKESKQNDLEKEISGYETLTFPKRPPSMEEEYRIREQRSLFRRKLRLKGLENPDGTLKNGLDFEELFEQEQERKRSKELEAAGENETADSSAGDENEGSGDMDVQ